MSGNNLFGMILRGHRLCYLHARLHGCFIRCQDGPDGTWLIEVVPRQLKYLKLGSGEYRVGGNGDELMDLSEALNGIRNPETPIRFVINDEGSVLTDAEAWK